MDAHRIMRRIHLFEFGDQRWLPQILRDAETAYLAVAYRFVPLAPLWAGKISSAFDRDEPGEILDLCSGAGGPMPAILDELVTRGFNPQARLTDLYPSLKPTPHSRISWIKEPIDATCLSPNLAGVRTMFSAFHHFPPDAAESILRSAFDHGRVICIFEAGSATALGIAAMIMVPLYVLALMPLARPFRWSYLVFTYLIPVIPLMIFWDGVVSVLRIYSPERLRELTQGLRRPTYGWEIGHIHVRGVPGNLPYLIGRPIS